MVLTTLDSVVDWSNILWFSCSSNLWTDTSLCPYHRCHHCGV